MTIFGQIVAGPPGAGKTTYCLGMEMMCTSIGRKVGIVNMDFANDKSKLPYTTILDVRDLITLESVIEDHDLGPNGSLLYCMEYLESNIDWLIDNLTSIQEEKDIKYFVFDFPGQVELYTHHRSVYNILEVMRKRLDSRLCSVYLVDSFCCCEPATFVSAVLLVSATMLRLALPHVNILSKIDLLPQYGQLPFNIDFYTDVLDISKILRYIDDPSGTRYDACDTDGSDDGSDDTDYDKRNVKIDNNRGLIHQKYKKMTSKLCDVLEDIQFVDFLPLNIQDTETVLRVLATIDKANGYTAVVNQAKDMNQYSQYEADYTSSMNYLFNYASNKANNSSEPSYFRSLGIQEKYTRDIPGSSADCIAADTTEQHNDFDGTNE